MLIDFYGTISAGDRAAVEATCARIVETFDLALSPRELAVKWGNRFFDVIGRSNNDAFRTLYECEVGSLRDTLADFDIGADAAPLVVELEEYWRNPPLYADAVDLLNRMDVPVCCVSNADIEPLLAAIERHGLEFDAVITSEQARSYKPAPEIFNQALQTLGVRAERALHVGDSLYSDITGAAALGIATAWLRREDRIHDIGSTRPEFTVSSLDEVARLFC